MVAASLLRFLASATALAALLSSAVPSAGAENGVIKVVLPVPPGGAGDIIARLLTDQVGRLNNRSFTIETRPGAGTCHPRICLTEHDYRQKDRKYENAHRC